MSITAAPQPLDLRALAREVIREHGPAVTGRDIALLARKMDQRIPVTEKSRVYFDLLAFLLRDVAKDVEGEVRRREWAPRLTEPPAAPPAREDPPVPAPPVPARVPAAGAPVITIHPAIPETEDAPAAEGERCGISDLPPSMCAHCQGAPGEPGPGPWADVKAAIEDGMTAEEAVDAALAGQEGNPLRGDTRKRLLAMAASRQRAATRAEERAAIHDGATANRYMAKLNLPGRAFKLPGGRSAVWGSASWDEHRARVVWMETFRNAYDLDIASHMRALQLAAEHPGARCLDDIPDWVDEIGEIPDRDVTSDPGN